MTIATAWVGTRSDGVSHLYFASDSRTRGGCVFDSCPKVLTLPRSDSAICFAGELDWSYPLMVQISNAIAAHQPSRTRHLDIAQLKDHLVRLTTDLVASIADRMIDFDATSATFIFGGYSWRASMFLVWTLTYDATRKVFVARPNQNFHAKLDQAAFIGDWAAKFRSRLHQSLTRDEHDAIHPEHLPLIELSQLLTETSQDDSIGGPPQVVRIGAHMNTRAFCVPWGTPPQKTIFGRKLFDYENCDYWSLDPFTGVISPPDPIGPREAELVE